MPSNDLIPCCPLLLLPSIFPSARVFSWCSSHQIAKVLELRFQHQSFRWIFRVYFLWDWLVWSPCCPRNSIKTLLQHHNSKASILWCSAFSIVQLSYLNTTTGKSIALTIWGFFSIVISLLFNTLSRLVIAFLPRSKCLFNFMAAVIICGDFGAQENKACHCFHSFHWKCSYETFQNGNKVLQNGNKW